MPNLEDLTIERPEPQPKRKRRVPFAGLALALVLLAGAAWFLQSRLATNAEAVELYTVPERTGRASGGFSAGGYLEVIPPGPVVVTTLTEGVVRSIDAVEGQTVRAGQIVARLDQAPLRQELRVQESAVALARARLARLQAGFRSEEVAQAKADLARAQARLWLSQVELTRNERLSAIGTAPRKVVEAARGDMAVAQAEVAARQTDVTLRTRGTRKDDIAIARAEVAVAESELARARWRLDASTIRAPMTGVVLERFIQSGDWIAPGGSGERGGAVLTLMDPKEVQAWIDVNQRDIGQVSVGQRAQLTTDSAPSRAIEGRVTRILPKANLQKNTVQVKVAIPNPPADLRPEMSVKVTFLPRNERGKAEQPAAISIPASALTLREGKTGVFLELDGRARFREVATTPGPQGRLAVSSGLTPGDRVILAPRGLTDGQAIEVER